MSPTTPRKYRRMQLSDAVEVVNFLRTVVRKVEGHEGYCEYISPWSDSAVADKFKVTSANVAGARQRVFGRLRPPLSDATLIERFNLLQRRFVELEEWARTAGYAPRDEN